MKTKCRFQIKTISIRVKQKKCVASKLEKLRINSILIKGQRKEVIFEYFTYYFGELNLKNSMNTTVFEVLDIWCK